MRFPPCYLPLLASLMLAGCASTRIEQTGTPLAQPLCMPQHSLTVLWGPQWRPDQKEPPLREAMALRGIQAFVADLPCQQPVAIQRIDVSAFAESPPTSQQLLALAASRGAAADTVLQITLRELGPKLFIGIPTLVEGGTEVVLQTRVAQRDLAALQADRHTHWQKGGPFYIKGVKTLDQDMLSALQQALAGSADTQP